MQIKNDTFSTTKLNRRIRKFFRNMVVSKPHQHHHHQDTEPIMDYPCIKESGIDTTMFSSRPVTRRVAELPSLRYGSVGAKTCTTGPLRVTDNFGLKKYEETSSTTTRFCSNGSNKTPKPPRRVRFTLPATDGPVSDGADNNGWLRTRAAPFSSKRSDAHRSDSSNSIVSASTSSSSNATGHHHHHHHHNLQQRRRSSSSTTTSSDIAISVPVTASPGPRNRVHPTGRYIKGTLSPTSSTAAPHAAPPPGGQALLRAARDGDDVMLRDLLRRASLVGIHENDLNAVDCSGRTALSYIASNGTIDVLEQILQLPNLNPNKPDNEGNTPLHFAAQAGQVECLNCILARCREIEIDARNNLGFTALMKAALQGRNKCAKLLLFAGANPTLRDNGRGFRADQWARFCGRYVCADVIEKHARQRLLERTTSYGNWGGESEMGARVVMGKVVPIPPVRQQSSNGFKSKLKRVFRTSSTLGRTTTTSPTDDQYSSARLVTQLTSAALCASSPVLPSGPTVPPVVKSLIRPLTVPKLQITLVNNNEDHPNQNLNGNKVANGTPAIVSVVEPNKPVRIKKKK